MRFLRLLATIVGAAIFFIAAWAIASNNVNLDLAKVDQIRGRVISFGVAKRVTKKYRIPQRVFRFTLDNYPLPFLAYRPSQNYSKLEQNIKIGDSVKLYFYKWKSDNYVNDVYQLEKDGQTLLDYKSFNRNSKFLVVFLICGGIFILIFGIWKFRRETRTANTQLLRKQGICTTLEP